MIIRQATSLKTTAALGLISLVLLSCTALSAQGVPVPMELFGGFSYMHFDSTTLGFASDSNLEGANLSLSVPHLVRNRQYHAFGVVADVSANYGSHLTVYNFLVGPQLTFNRKGFTFFVHGLFGKGRERFGIPQAQFFPGYSSLGRAYAFGGGVQKNWRPSLAVRILQLDYINNSNFDVTQNNLRVSTGLVFQFGGK